MKEERLYRVIFYAEGTEVTHWPISQDGTLGEAQIEIRISSHGKPEPTCVEEDTGIVTGTKPFRGDGEVEIGKIDQIQNDILWTMNRNMVQVAIHSL